MSSKLNIESLADRLCKAEAFDDQLYTKFGVKRGLRNYDGTGVLAGITRVSNVHGYLINEYERVPCEGELFYRGVSVNDIIEATDRFDRFGYDEASWLLLMGSLPTKDDLDFYQTTIDEYSDPPASFIEDMIMRAPSPDIMNKLARSVLALYSYDENPDDNSVDNVLRQSLSIIACMPMIMTAAYQVKKRYYDNESFFLHSPVPGQSMAENILSMLRFDRKFTHDEARLLDKCLILHAEHGGGNNSTFAVRALTSSGTDTFSAIAAGIGALKGPRHGGANIKVVKMLDDIKANVRDYKDDDEIGAYLQKMLKREAGDRSGLIYGVGHAVYTLSDPRATILRKAAEEQCDSFGMREDFDLLYAVERLAPELLQNKMQDGNAICANVDLYSGLVYRMLGIPNELFTPLFALARLSGWCAHRLEEIITCRRIMRPAYRPFHGRLPYIDLENRKED
jgi:citrate synthase